MGTFICVYLPRVDHLVYLIELNCPKKKEGTIQLRDLAKSRLVFLSGVLAKWLCSSLCF